MSENLAGAAEQKPCRVIRHTPPAQVRSFPAVPHAVPVARSWVSRQLRLDQVQSSIVESAELLVSELAANAVRHARGSAFQVRLSVGAEIEVAVHDADTSLPHPRRPDHWQPGGRGLLLVDAIADSWGTTTEDGGKRVWFRLSRTSRSRLRGTGPTQG